MVRDIFMKFHYLSRVNFYAMFDEYGQMLFTSHTNSGFEKVYSLDIPTSNKVTFYEKFGTAENVIFVIFAIALYAYATVTIIKMREKKTK